MTKKKAIYTIDGEPASLRDVKSGAKADALKDYITQKHASSLGFKDTTLRSGRNSGKIRAMKIGTTWFYSKQDLVDLIKTSKR